MDGTSRPHGQAQKESVARMTAKFETKSVPGKTRERVPGRWSEKVVGKESGGRERVPGRWSEEWSDTNPSSSGAPVTAPQLHRCYSREGINVENMVQAQSRCRKATNISFYGFCYLKTHKCNLQGAVGQKGKAHPLAPHF